MDESIICIEILESEALEMEDIQLDKYSEVDKIIPTITCQADHEGKDLDVNPKKSEEHTKDNNER